MFTTNLFEIKIQQEELQRRAAHLRLVKSLEISKGSSSKPTKRVVSPTWMVQQETCTLARAAY
jgi:hypothetical protein